VIAHKCSTGRIFATFRYPRFAQNWRWILAANAFVKGCPFFFELQTLLTWMIEPTAVSFSDFLLENLIARQRRPATAGERQGRKRALHGLCYFAGCFFLIFLPLTFFTSAAADIEPNPLRAAALEIGFEGFPPHYRADADVSPISAEQRSALAASMSPELRRAAVQPADTLFAAAFPRASAWEVPLSGAAKRELAHRQLEYRIALSLTFQAPTTRSYTQRPLFLRTGPIGDSGADAIDLGGGRLPRAVFAVPGVEMKRSDEGEAQRLVCVDGISWALTSDYVLIVYSQPACEGVRGAVQTASSGTSLIFYICLVALIGTVTRERALGRFDKMWIRRLDVPQRLYRMCMAIHLCRDGGDSDREARLVSEFLDRMRSPEQVLALTAKD
jgi:hypothetical protein